MKRISAPQKISSSGCSETRHDRILGILPEAWIYWPNCRNGLVRPLFRSRDVVVRGVRLSLGNTLDGFRFFQPIDSGFRMGERAILRIIGSRRLAAVFWTIGLLRILLRTSATPSQHGVANLLMLLRSKRISTPWVAGSNPAGIASDFKGMRVLFSINSCTIPK